MLSIEIVLGFISSITFFALIFIASFVDLPTYVRVLMIVGGFIIFAFGVHFCLVIEKDAGYYVCPHCKHCRVPTYKQVLLAMHKGRTRYLKCPKCGKKGWNKKVVTNENDKDDA